MRLTFKGHTSHDPAVTAVTVFKIIRDKTQDQEVVQLAIHIHGVTAPDDLLFEAQPAKESGCGPLVGGHLGDELPHARLKSRIEDDLEEGGAEAAAAHGRVDEDADLAHVSGPAKTAAIDRGVADDFVLGEGDNGGGASPRYVREPILDIVGISDVASQEAEVVCGQPPSEAEDRIPIGTAKRTQNDLAVCKNDRASRTMDRDRRRGFGDFGHSSRLSTIQNLNGIAG